MVDFFSAEERERRFRKSDSLEERYPVPMRSISNGEYDPLPQTPAQREVEARLRVAIAEEHAQRPRASSRRELPPDRQAAWPRLSSR